MIVAASTWQRPLSWKHWEGQGDDRHIRVFSPGCHRVRAQVPVICSAASSGGQGWVFRYQPGAAVAACALFRSRCRHRC
jgi:hypothetical protein